MPHHQSGKETKIQAQVGCVGLSHGLFEAPKVQGFLIEELKFACMAFGVNPPIDLGTCR